MKAFRRSTKSLGSNSDKTHHISIPQKDAIAIEPPKKVIKALYDYHPDNQDNRYLGFSQGDFLHVVGRENDPDWYEACNPIVGTRGLVPVNYFELISKQVRNSGGIDPAQPNGHQMNLVDRTVASSRIQSMQRPGHDSGYAPAANGGGGGAAPFPADGQGLRMSKLGRQSGAMVYGIVLYDFKAERTDELQANAGEAIIVIAQSTPEWFVAKPITRLGGPGLIPVSFIEIRDMTTGQAVADPHKAVQSAGVPKVEEWKRMAASYKNSSIPLGKLTSAQADEPERSPSQAGTADYAPGPQQQQHMSQQQQQQQDRYSQLSVPLKARVPRYAHQEMKYWFVVEAYMDDGKYWELNREYTDFYALQTALMEEFPEKSGKVAGYKRTLPYMPGPLPWVTERLTAERREHMDRYLSQLLNMGADIQNSQPVRDFFAPRDGDAPMDQQNMSETDSEWVRLSQGSSQQSFSQQQPPLDSRGSSSGNLSGHMSPGKGSQQQPFPPPSQQQQQAPSPGQSHYRNQSDLRTPNGSGQYAPPPAPTAGGGGGAKVKVKAYLGDSNIVILRMDEGFDYQTLLDKVRERWLLEHPGRTDADAFYIEWKDDANGAFSDLASDADLQRAHDAGEKLTVRVGVQRGY